MTNETMKDGERAECEAAFHHLSHATALDEGLAAYRDPKMQGVWEGWQARAAAPQAALDECRNRVKTYLDTYKGMRGVDPEIIHTINSDELRVSDLRALLQAPIERISDDRVSVIHALQKALAYWMPTVFDERSAHDAYLLVGYEGETETRCWGDEMIDALPRWTPVGEALPDEPGFYLVMLAPDNDWGLMADTPLQVEFDAYNNKPKAFTCLYDYRADEDITEAVTHWMPLPDVPAAARKAEIERNSQESK